MKEKALRLVQFSDKASGENRVGVVDGDTLRVVAGVRGIRELALEAAREGGTIPERIRSAGFEGNISYDEVIADGRLLPPISHPDPAHVLVTGTGLTHLGSASARSAMHEKVGGREEDLTDSMKMFKWGIEGGKPAPGETGVEPEWFYKGDGSWIVSPGAGLELADFALDGGEEPEIAGIYVIADDGTPCRAGFALSNEFSDHKRERQNYLLLAHSKLCNSSIGPELLVGDLPGNVEGVTRIVRDGETVWQKPFVSGEDNMSHSIANLEHHHFKYSRFRRPGDVHVHFFGTATLSFSDGFSAVPGDVFEISAEGFGRPLRNTLVRAASNSGPVRPLYSGDLPP